MGEVEKKGWYIGTPNGIVLCVDHFDSKEELIEGRFYHKYRTDAVTFTGADELLRKMEQFFDEINFPHPFTTLRTFEGEKETCVRRGESGMKSTDEELLRRHGDLGTFIIRVQHRQNSSWQGRITWMEEDRTVYFRSIWEMIKLVESALDSVGAEKDSVEVSWDND